MNGMLESVVILLLTVNLVMQLGLWRQLSRLESVRAVEPVPPPAWNPMSHLLQRTPERRKPKAKSDEDLWLEEQKERERQRHDMM